MANEKLTSDASVGSPSVTDFQTSTAEGGSSEVLDSFESKAIEAAADSIITKSEIQDSLSKFLGTLASNAVISEKDPIRQLSEATPSIGTFVDSLMESIFKFKESTPQGYLLKTQLDSGNITEEQFKSDVGAIVVTAEQAQAAVSGVIANETQQLLLSLSSDSELKTISHMISTLGVNPNPSTPQSGRRFAGLKKDPADPTGKTYLPVDKLDTDSSGNPINAYTDDALIFKKINTPDHIADVVDERNPNVTPYTSTVWTDTTLLTAKPPISEYTPEVVDERNPNITPYLPTKFKDEKLGFFIDIVKLAKEVAERNLKTSASALLTLKPQPRIMTGARAVVKINGLAAALCVSVSYEITTGWEEIRGVDDLVPNDLAPTSYSVKGTMVLYRIPNGSPVEMWLQQDMYRGVIWPYSTIEIRDKRTDELIMLVKRAAITSRSESFVKGQLTTSTLGFVGIGFRDEKMPSFLPETLRPSPLF